MSTKQRRFVRLLVSSRSRSRFLSTPFPDRYNSLLRGVARQLGDLKKAVKGLVVVTPELEEISQALLQGKVSTTYSAAGPTHGAVRSIAIAPLIGCAINLPRYVQHI